MLMFDYDAPADALAGRIILITGAGRGIGAAVARACAAHGATLILLGKTAANLQGVAEQIRAAGHPAPWALPFDLLTATESDYQRLATQVAERFGRLDGLLHNASLIGPRTDLEAIPGEVFAQVLHVNVNATFLLTQALIPLLRKASDASLVFTSSSVGRQGRAQWGAYAVSKFATEGLMQTLADECNGSPLRANSVNPGGTRTAMRAAAYPQEDPQQVPSPDEIVPVYLYLLGPASRGVNGQAFNARR